MKPAGLDRHGLIEELSVRTNFHKKYAREFLNTLIDIFRECLEKEVEINVQGWGRLYFQPYPARRGFRAKDYRLAKLQDPQTMKADFYIDYPATKRALFRLSKNLRRALREGPPEDEEKED
jgi:nucleoid DNA-binding protein